MGAMPTYRANHFRRHLAHETMAMGIGHHEYVAPDDAAAIKTAKSLFADQYAEATDRIGIVEIQEGRDPRHVWLTGDH
jgi:hypothetical protein